MAAVMTGGLALSVREGWSSRGPADAAGETRGKQKGGGEGGEWLRYGSEQHCSAAKRGRRGKDHSSRNLLLEGGEVSHYCAWLSVVRLSDYMPVSPRKKGYFRAWGGPRPALGGRV